ncbi:hypothetical protein CANCADRAFT_70910 [Tortispora caseinolytica NRRL Y-17796]|uniref:MATE efflux family protein n=1 Tax=Tortispora caseinolytica NRRL Y-17796 TaxID=767744 RepID=A0A1E4TI69_9ASCO|nr:hypothetical protein CANCADRAFT_70910 [Tortispora caseinolytica NRRL Y-17796]
MATESTRLLPDSELDTKPISRAAVIREVIFLLKSSLPVILAYCLQNSLQTVSVLIVGRLGPHELAVASFSYMFAMATAWLIGLGGTTAIDSLASVSFTGSSDPTELGVILQRGILVLTALYLPVTLLWWNAEPVLLALGQHTELAADTARFLRVLIPGGIGYIYFESLKKYLQAQGIMTAGSYVLAVTTVINGFLNYLTVHVWHLGLLGAPLATSISYWLCVVFMLLYICFVSGKRCWGGWSRLALRNLSTFTRLAVMGVFHVGTEWWAFEIVALAAGKLGTIPLAAQSVIMTSDQVMNTIPFGLGVATSSRVGNELGASSARGASLSAHTGAALSVLLGLIVMTILLATRDVFGYIFTDDHDTVVLVSEIMPYVALFQIADGLNGSCGGALRGMGLQHIGALVNIVAYYCFALPLGIYLAFHGWGLVGLWFGQCLALFVVGILEWIIVYRTKWTVQIEKALNRL